MCDFAFFATFFRRSNRDNLTAADAAFRAEVDHIIRGLDDVEIVLDDEQAAAVVDQRAEGGEKFVDVVEVQARSSVRRR